MADIEVPIRSRRSMRGALFQHLQHAVPAPQLLIHGGGRIRLHASGGDLLLGTAEVVASVLVIGAVIRAVREYRDPHGRSGHGAHGQVDWVDLLLAAMLMTEAVAHWHETGGWPRPTLLTAAGMLALGLLHGRMTAKRERRRALRVTDDGVTMGLRFFRRFTARWPDIASVEIEPTRARIVTRTGRIQQFDLRDLEGADRVTAALEVIRTRALAADAST